jgi:hypothetical protein
MHMPERSIQNGEARFLVKLIKFYSNSKNHFAFTNFSMKIKSRVKDECENLDLAKEGRVRRCHHNIKPHTCWGIGRHIQHGKKTLYAS